MAWTVAAFAGGMRLLDHLGVSIIARASARGGASCEAVARCGARIPACRAELESKPRATALARRIVNTPDYA